ncbi:unnamed protein product [Cylicostephanus goldi]|uniref:Uncharacterized protein n=1 Tax=Cylicostephanus goldi TaxID=71465 RepID=A0A3P7MQ96_CYLGO|nr:unnamed protein product [Cylicostephanus goldi]
MASEESTQNTLNDEQLQELMNRMSVEDRNELTGRLQKCSQEFELIFNAGNAQFVASSIFISLLKKLSDDTNSWSTDCCRCGSWFVSCAR